MWIVMIAVAACQTLSATPVNDLTGRWVAVPAVAARATPDVPGADAGSVGAVVLQEGSASVTLTADDGAPIEAPFATTGAVRAERRGSSLRISYRTRLELPGSAATLEHVEQFELQADGTVQRTWSVSDARQTVRGIQVLQRETR